MAPLINLILALASPFVAQQLPPSQLISWVPAECDTIQSEPVSYRVPFSIVNDDSEVPIAQFRFVAISGDPETPGSCPIMACEAPENWACAFGAWAALADEHRVDPGETLSGFSITVSSPYCCFQVVADGPVFNILAIDTLCAPCDMPVQNSQSTWGRVKATYR